MKYILALDQGTTSSRALVFDESGQTVALAQQEFAQHFPRPGWVEHDANEIWRTQQAVARQALEMAAQQGKRVGALAITNQRETTVLWDRGTGEPLAPAIVWQDRRTANACEALYRQGRADWIQQRTGLVLDSYFSGTKLAWLLDHVPGARRRAERGELAFGTIDSWLIWKLTEGRVHATDPSNASRTLLFNLNTLSWDADLLRLFDIPPSILPSIRPSAQWFGDTTLNSLGSVLPIMGVVGDQQAATFGQNCFAPGMAKNTYGTGCFMLMNTGDRASISQHRLLSTVGWQGPGGSPQTAYCLEGAVFMGGAIVQWLRDGLGFIHQAADIEPLADSVSDTGDVVLVPAFTGLGAPYWDSSARGTLLGMTRGTTQAHIGRAALESIAHQSVDVFLTMAKDSGLPVKELRVDGGASRNNLLMQIQADLLGVPVVRPRCTETTALGAAYLAGFALGLWKSAEDLQNQWQVDRRFEPRIPAARRDALRQRWLEALERSRHWVDVAD